MKMFKKWILKMIMDDVRSTVDNAVSNVTNHIYEDVLDAVKEDIPDAEDIADKVASDDIAGFIDVDAVASELDTREIAREVADQIDLDDLAAKIGQEIDIDAVADCISPRKWINTLFDEREKRKAQKRAALLQFKKEALVGGDFCVGKTAQGEDVHVVEWMDGNIKRASLYVGNLEINDTKDRLVELFNKIVRK